MATFYKDFRIGALIGANLDTEEFGRSKYIIFHDGKAFVSGKEIVIADLDTIGCFSDEEKNMLECEAISPYIFDLIKQRLLEVTPEGFVTIIGDSKVTFSYASVSNLELWNVVRHIMSVVSPCSGEPDDKVSRFYLSPASVARMALALGASKGHLRFKMYGPYAKIESRVNNGIVGYIPIRYVNQ